MNRRAEIESALINVLRDAGIRDYWIEDRKKHRQLIYRHRGRKGAYTMPSSPSDRKSILACVAELRRMVGRPQKIPGRRVKRERNKVRVVSLPRMTPTPDPWEDLIDYLDSLKWDEAREAYRRAPHGCRTAAYRNLQAETHRQLAECIRRAG